MLMSPVSMLMIHNPMTVAMGNKDEMERAIAMLDEVKESIMNAYEIKSGQSRAKISHLMDAETWMNANKALELGFIDGILSRDEVSEDTEQPNVPVMFSEATVVNSLMGKIAEKCRIAKPAEPEPTGRSVEDLRKHLNSIKNYL